MPTACVNILLQNCFGMEHVQRQFIYVASFKLLSFIYIEFRFLCKFDRAKTFFATNMSNSTKNVRTFIKIQSTSIKIT